jgi:hypothetical protein
VLAAILALFIAGVVSVPGQQPQLTRDGDRVFMVVAREGQVGVLRSEDAGHSFAEVTPITVDGKMSAGMHRGPRVAATRAALLVALVAGAQGGGKDGDVVLYRSLDGARTWGPAVVINDVPAAAREGLHAMSATAEGLVVITWLDLRATGTRLYGAVSRDHGATWNKNVLVYSSPEGSICQCCHPSIATDGTDIAVMFRNSVAGSRDLYVTRSTDGSTFAAAEKQGSGTWLLQACPMDGGAVVLGPAGTSTVWRRESDIFLTTPGSPEQRLGTGRDPAMATAPAGVDVAWTTPEGIRLVRGSESTLVGPGKFAALLGFPRHTLVAWEQQGQVATKVVPR